MDIFLLINLTPCLYGIRTSGCTRSEFLRHSFAMATNLLLVVTGASRGLGRAIAVTFNRHPDPSIKYVKTLLIARSLSGLEETKTAILEQANSNRAKDISLHTIDLGDLDNLNEGLDSILETVTKESFDRIIFINNAGSLGKLGPCWESQSIAELRRTVDLNITSALWTSVKFAQFAADRENSIRETTIVNISSLAAVQAMPSMGIYSSGKAVRHSINSQWTMFHNLSH